MSRRDRYHDIVKNALILEGWQITHDPLSFRSEPELSTDLGAERPIAATRGNEKIAVEIKSFLRDSQVSELEKAMGQYELYRWLLQESEPDRILYIAIPIHAYEGIFSQAIGKMVISKLQMRLIVYSILGEGDLKWIHPL
ncbi:XisH family protein [Thiofilum flexile]|uniref:XisH family protein n=1 Tax=Thiofilum flexile TaxID=125627 RepID=UPI000363C070|nr:XisH family protein [Thiofilum flexile]